MPIVLGALGALALLGAAATFRLLWSLDEPLWLDEAYSAYAAGKGFHFLWHVVPTYETHPPFYYSVLRAWTLVFGDGLTGLRSLGLVCGLATLPVLWAAARDLARHVGLPDRRVAWAATAFAAFSISLVAMTREVRPYPVMILVYALGMWSLIRIGAATVRGRLPRPALAGYLLCLALIGWLHNLGALYAVAMGLALLCVVVGRGLSRRDWTILVGGHVVVALLWVPALLILLDQAPTWIRSTWLHFNPRSMQVFLPVLYGAPGRVGMTATIVLLALGLWRSARAAAGRMAAVLALLAFLPVAASVAISMTITPVFIVRIMTATAVPAMLMLGIGAVGHGRAIARIVGAVAGIVLIGEMVRIDINERRSGPTQDWYAVTRFLATGYRPGDVVLAYPNEAALPLQYALRDKGIAIPVVPVPTPVPSIGVGGWYPTGSRGVVSLPRARLRAIARAPGIAAAPTVWLLRLGAFTYDRGDVFLDELQRRRRRGPHLFGDPIDLVGLRKPVPGRPAQRR